MGRAGRITLLSFTLYGRCSAGECKLNRCTIFIIEDTSHHFLHRWCRAMNGCRPSPLGRTAPPCNAASPREKRNDEGNRQHKLKGIETLREGLQE